MESKESAASQSPVENWMVDDLTVHPFNLEIYGEPDAGLAENIDNFGLQTPIKVDPEGRILSGARRWTAVKKLGWSRIPAQVPDIDWSSDTGIQLYILIANAYRKQKTSYQQKREADAYRRLLDEGQLTKEELADMARDRGAKVPAAGRDRPLTKTEKNERTANSLAAKAAGLDRSTYRRYRYLTDGGATDAIRDSLEAGEISENQAQSLRSSLSNTISKVKRDEIGVRTADHKVREQIREATKEHTLSPDERARREAQEAVENVRKKGKAYISALERLFMDHRENLNGELALVVAATFQEHRGLLLEQLPRGFLEDGKQGVELVDGNGHDALEVEGELVG